SFSPTFCQTVFEAGYFITNNDERIDCLIGNYEWINNPTDFSYKFVGNDETLVKKIFEVKEFGIRNSYKFIRATVNIDLSTDDPRNLSTNRNPIWKKDTVYLKVLIEGKASLYSLQNGNLFRYFYNIDGKEINQLIYKRHFLSAGVIAVNNSFQQQLFNEVRCSTTQIKDVNKLAYKENHLTKYFIGFLACNGDMSQLNKVRKSRIRNINACLGTGTQFNLNSNSLNRSLTLTVEFESFVTNKKKWSFFLDPTAYIISSGSTLLLLSFGTRYYLRFNNRTGLFLNLSLIGPYVGIYKTDQLFGVTILPMAGVGFIYDRFRIEGRVPAINDAKLLTTLTVGYQLYNKKKQ
ncbi:MAG: hypothetical protein ACKO96_21155, partial [Flammeovirgaceae bacterium]